MIISYKEPENLRFAPIMIFNFYFAFLIDIIDIITYGQYSPYYVTQTSANGSAVYWSSDFRLFQIANLLNIQGVPRNMTVGECLLP